MTILEAIANAQINCQRKLARLPLLVLTPVAVIEDLQIASKWFYLFDPTHYQETDTNNYVYLKLFTDYSPETNRLGDSPGLKTTFSRTGYGASTIKRGFKATVIQKERVILEVLQKLILISESSKYNQFSPIKVVDFCSVELGDRFIYNNRLATVRYGEMIIDETPPLGYDQNYINSNWSLTFTEVNLRLK
ncbi:hypothetical protein [Nostoc punctiforme]|uniref:Uncharacterized protein n=2 Tax=Nostoc punctiforme TaxID=272131 RepID=B2ITA9_NOSP7|nr:hypothetical protein [Nostoc punctiforme]ACC81140.1 hypothetical protein Npun_R2586 [Nostoc punctiforme PCC 73102]RCJ29187.1 hypothetical protein A6769_35930 [Nostoc punctiforme NIES-2108]